jgi:hypothetical protein
MQALLDSDQFCMLAMSGLLDDACTILGGDISACARLPALPYMLKRGRLRAKYGDLCDGVIALAKSIPEVPDAKPELVNLLIGRHDIDVGEAQLFAVAAETGAYVTTGDKRALNSLKDVEPFPTLLHGRIVCTEAMLRELCSKLGYREVVRRLTPIRHTSGVLAICFGGMDPDPRSGLESFRRALNEEVQPLILWSPPPTGAS